MLPLDSSGRVALIGGLARTPRYQGAGSSRVNPTKVVSALAAFERRHLAVTFAQGYTTDATASTELIDEAVRIAADSDIRLGSRS